MKCLITLNTHKILLVTVLLVERDLAVELAANDREARESDEITHLISTNFA